MATSKNIERALVIAVVNPNYNGRKVYGMFYVKEQIGDLLKVSLLWDMDWPDAERGKVNSPYHKIKELHLSDIVVFVNRLTEEQKAYFTFWGLDYRFVKDDDALGRLVNEFDMDLEHIGYDGESEVGTFFTCCRINSYARNIIPEGIYIYSLRASDEDDAQPGSIEQSVMVNHYGDILTMRPLPVPVMLEIEHIEYDEDGNIISI